MILSIACWKVIAAQNMELPGSFLWTYWNFTCSWANILAKYATRSWILFGASPKLIKEISFPNKDAWIEFCTVRLPRFTGNWARRSSYVWSTWRKCHQSQSDRKILEAPFSLELFGKQVHYIAAPNPYVREIFSYIPVAIKRNKFPIFFQKMQEHQL